MFRNKQVAETGHPQHFRPSYTLYHDKSIPHLYRLIAANRNEPNSWNSSRCQHPAAAARSPCDHGGRHRSAPSIRSASASDSCATRHPPPAATTIAIATRRASKCRQKRERNNDNDNGNNDAPMHARSSKENIHAC